MNDEDKTLPTKRMKQAKDVAAVHGLLDKGFEHISLSYRVLKKQACLNLSTIVKDMPRCLRKIELDNCKISDKSGIDIFNAVASNDTIEHLEVSSNNLGTASFKACLDALKANKTLTHLDLGNNRSLGHTGANIISIALNLNSTLRILFLNKCGIPPKGMIFIAEAMEKNTGLRFLSVSQNQGTPEVGMAFAKMLEVNKTLVQLHFQGGSKKIKDKGGIAIAQALEKNTVLENIWLDGQAFKDPAFVAFGLMLAKNKTLKIMGLAANKYGEKGLRSLEEALNVNSTIERLFGVSSMTVDAILDANRSDKEQMESMMLDSVLTQGVAKGPLMRSKIMLVGSGRSGKTATVNSLLGVPFVPEWRSTIGAELREAKVNEKEGWTKTGRGSMFELSNEFAARVALQQLDANAKLAEPDPNEPNVELTTGQNVKGEQELKAVEMNKENLAEADGGVDEGDAGDGFNPFDNIDQNDLEDEDPKEEHSDEDEGPQPLNTGVLPAPMIHKSHFNLNRVVNLKEIMKDAKKTQDTVKLSLWDYGGQRIFYSLHHLFLTKKGIYVLVFDMRVMLRDPSMCRVYLNFWLNSLGLHAPETPLMLVGTYLDEVKTEEDLNIVNQRLIAVLEKFPFSIVPDETLGYQFFPISNKTGLGVRAAKSAIDRIARSQSYIYDMIPLNWIFTIESLLRSKRAYVTTTDFALAAKGFRINAPSELAKMLRLFHELGLVLHLTHTSSLSEVVTLRPDWLIRSIGRIIRDSKLHKHNQSALKEEGLTADSERLFKDGILTDTFVQFMWSEERVDFLLDLMRQTLLLCDWNFNKQDTGDKKNSHSKLYFVPSLVTGSKDLEEYDDDMDHKDIKTAPTKEFDFSKTEKEEEEGKEGQKDEIYENPNLKNICFFEFKFLPDGVFDRLICLCVAHSNLLGSEQAPTVSSEFVEISFGKGIFVKLYEKKAIDTIYVELRDNEENLKHAQNSLAIIQSMLKKLQSDIIGSGLAWKLFFPQPDKTYISFDEAADSGLQPWFVNVSKEDYAKKINTAEHINVENFLEGLQEL